MHGEAGVRGAAQQAVELLDLAPLALPPHPDAFAGVPLPHAMEQEEACRPVGVVRGVERPMPARAAARIAVVARASRPPRREVAQEGEVQMRIGCCRAPAPRGAPELCDALHAVEQRRDDDHGARRRGHPIGGRARQAPRRDQAADHPLHDLDGELACGQEQQQARRPRAPAVTPARRESHAGASSAAVRSRDRAEVGRGGVREEEARPRPPTRRLVETSLSRSAGVPADQVVARRGPRVVGRRPLGDLPRTLDAPERHTQLGVAGGLRQLLHGLPVAVAAVEVHAAVHRGRIALQHLLDQADALEVERPVERRRRTGGW